MNRNPASSSPSKPIPKFYFSKPSSLSKGPKASSISLPKLNSVNLSVASPKSTTMKKPDATMNKSYYSSPRVAKSISKSPLNQSTHLLKSAFNVNYADDESLAVDPFDLPKTKEKNTLNEVEQAIRLTLRLKKRVIPSSSFSSSTFPMLASLKVSELKSTIKAPLDLVCVIDHSGSMSGEKMELVKESFRYLLKFLDDSDRLSIVIFDDKATRLIPLVRTNERNKAIIMYKLKHVQGEGGTDIKLGMTHAFEILKQRREKNPVTSIFLLSDGLDDGAQQRVKATLSKYNITDDVSINTFGFGKDHDPQLMNDIADLRDGNFYFVEKLDTVDEAFVDCLGGLLSAIGQNVTIKISPEQSDILKGVEIVKAYGHASMWTKEGNAFITKMSNIMSGRQKDFVLELSIPPNPKELQDHEKRIKVASAEANLTTIDGKPITKKAKLFITLLNETEEPKEYEEPHREVMKNFYRVKGASVIGEARKLADQNNHNEAKKILQNFKEELEGSFLRAEVFIKNLIKDIEKALEDADPRMYELCGKHNMMENARAQMCQKPNLKSANSYQNSVQMSMLSEVKTMKSKK